MTDATNGNKTNTERRQAQKLKLLSQIRHERISLRGLPGWQNDKDIVIATLKHDGNDLIHASDFLRRDPEVVLVAVRQNGLALRWANNLLSENKMVVLTAVQQDGTALQYAAHPLRADPDIAITALHQTPLCMPIIAPSLRSSPDFAQRCLEEGLDTDALSHLSADFASALQRTLIAHMPRPIIDGWSAQITAPLTPPAHQR